jgi:hypothetical protein
VFLPIHSTVVELTGAGMKRNTLRYLVNALDLHHYPVHSYALPSCVNNGELEPWAVPMHTGPYYDECTARNLSSNDMSIVPVCAAAHAHAPTVVPMHMFRQVSCSFLFAFVRKILGFISPTS